jgi:hypothetical protein
MLALVLAVARSSRIRYAASCLAMLALLVVLGATFYLLLPGGGLSPQELYSPSRAAQLPANLLPWLAPLWLAGAFLFQLRAIVCWMGIRHAVLHELDCRFVRQIVEKPSNVRVEHPVHSLPPDSHCQCVQRLVRVATRPEPIRVAFEVHLVDLIENGHHGLLDDLVLQRCNAQRTSPSVGLRNIDSSRWLCLIRSTVYSAV